MTVSRPPINAGHMMLRERAKWVYDHVPAGVGDVLDVGCYDGGGTSWLAGKARRLVGIDTDAPAIARGRERYPNLEFVYASAHELPFSDNSFDCVVFSEVLEHLPSDIEIQTIREIWRVLRPSGLLILTTPHWGLFWWLDPMMAKTLLRRAASSMVALARRSRGPRPYLKGHKHYRMPEIDELFSGLFHIDLLYRNSLLLHPLSTAMGALPLGIGTTSLLLRLRQKISDWDYDHSFGNAS